MVYQNNGFHDDRLLALIEQDKEERLESTLLSMSKVQSLPITTQTRDRGRSLDVLNIRKNTKSPIKNNKQNKTSTKRNNYTKLPTTKAIKANSAIIVQSHCLNHYLMMFMMTKIYFVTMWRVQYVLLLKKKEPKS